MDIRSIFFSKTTQDFIAEGKKASDFTFLELLHGYIYARWPYLYIGIGTGEHPSVKYLGPLAELFNRLITKKKDDERLDEVIEFADTYHGKVVPLESAARLVTINEEINIPDLEQVIPYKRARAIIMKNPDHIIALQCPCRSSRSNPCLPLDVCLIVGEPFASFVYEHHPHKSRWISQDEAVSILKAEDERGHVHHAFFKDAMLGRFYAICNCCSCCCGAMQAQRSGTPMLASSGYISQVDEDLCIGCGDCADCCQFEALDHSEFTPLIDVQLCMGCGVCVNQCEQGALSLNRDESKGIPLEICELMQNSVLNQKPL